MKETLFSKELFITGSNNIFVFGSNLAGRHGKGAAKFAKEFCGAVYGQGFGLQGNSFAIPTKDENLRTLPLEPIHSFVRQFLHFAEQNKDKLFYVTRIGCGLAGYTDIQIAPMFAHTPPNCILPAMWNVEENNSIILLDKPE